jgi:hypothetical protein
MDIVYREDSPLLHCEKTAKCHVNHTHGLWKSCAIQVEKPRISSAFLALPVDFLWDDLYIL